MSEELNRRRRERYASDPVYRARVVAGVRKSYRRRHAGDKFQSCLSAVSGIDSHRHGAHRAAAPSYRVAWTLTVTELAAAIGRNAQVVARWVAAGRFPAPKFETRVDGHAGPRVYTAVQAKAIARVMAEHQAATPYYREDHLKTKSRLFEAMEV